MIAGAICGMILGTIVVRWIISLVGRRTKLPDSMVEDARSGDLTFEELQDYLNGPKED